MHYKCLKCNSYDTIQYIFVHSKADDYGQLSLAHGTETKKISKTEAETSRLNRGRVKHKKAEPMSRYINKQMKINTEAMQAAGC